VAGLAANWKKSTRSNGSDSCVEVREHGECVEIRDSKDPSGPVLSFDRETFASFVQAIRGGTLDPN
jgi:hypothetical protein